MKEREFIVKSFGFDIELDGGLDLDLVETYFEEELEIPDSCVDSFEYHNDYVKIKLVNSREYYNDDWYINLQRVV